MKTTNDVENIARLTAEKLGEGWSTQGTVLGAQLTGPNGMKIRLELNRQLVKVYAYNVPEDSGVPSGEFTVDQNLIGYFICNSLYPQYARYLEDAKEEVVDVKRWRERTEEAIKSFAAAAGGPDLFHIGGQDGEIESYFPAHDCLVTVNAEYGGASVINIKVPPRLDLGHFALTWKEEVSA
jgi:hypothetical protein